MRSIQRTILASFSLPLIICFSQAFAAEHDVTHDEMQALLKERDAAIIHLQHTVKDLITRGLTRAERLILILYYYEEMTMKEIGITLDLSESRVSQMHSSILKRLKEQLELRRKELVN